VAAQLVASRVVLSSTQLVSPQILTAHFPVTFLGLSPVSGVYIAVVI
jgi:hypothetical protein